MRVLLLEIGSAIAGHVQYGSMTFIAVSHIPHSAVAHIAMDAASAAEEKGRLATAFWSCFHIQRPMGLLGHSNSNLIKSNRGLRQQPAVDP